MNNKKSSLKNVNFLFVLFHSSWLTWQSCLQKGSFYLSVSLSISRLLLSLPQCGHTWERKVPFTMAVATSTKGSLREDLTCAICCDLFREPVMLACMHHFCKPCISRYWRGIQGPVTCPQCRKEFSSRQFQTNYLVAAMVEKVRATTSDTSIKNLEVSSGLRGMLNHGSCWLPSTPLLLLIWNVLLSVWQPNTNNLMLQSKLYVTFELYKLNTIVFSVSVHICVYVTVVPLWTCLAWMARGKVHSPLPFYIALYDRIYDLTTAGEPMYTARVIKPPVHFNIIQSKIPVINPKSLLSLIVLHTAPERSLFNFMIVSKGVV